MTQHDAKTRMKHMLEHAREAVATLGDRDAESLGANRILLLALTRLVEVVGEAAARVPPEARSEYAQVPWREAADTRNLLIHGYDIVRHDILHATIRVHFPPLIAQLEQILGEGPPE